MIPKSLRDKLELAAGDELDVSEREGRLELAPVAAKVWLEDRDGHLVAVAEDAPALTADAVRDVLERARR